MGCSSTTKRQTPNISVQGYSTRHIIYNMHNGVSARAGRSVERAHAGIAFFTRDEPFRPKSNWLVKEQKERGSGACATRDRGDRHTQPIDAIIHGVDVSHVLDGQTAPVHGVHAEAVHLRVRILRWFKGLHVQGIFSLKFSLKDFTFHHEETNFV